MPPVSSSGVMHARVARHVLAHVVHADIHQLHRVERGAAEMRRGRRMRGAAGEDEIRARVGERRRHRDFPEAVRMPGDGDVGVFKRAGAHHEGLGCAAFFRRAAVIAHAAGHLVLGEPVLHRGRGEQRRGTEQIVAATMAVAAGLDRTVLGDAGLLAEARQRVIFTHEGNDRTALTPLAHHRGRDARDVLGDAETLVAQLGEMLGGGPRLGVAHLGHAPDPVAEVDETRLDRVDATPDVAAVIHASVRDLLVKRSGNG